MAPSRAYVPSAALLRALSCPPLSRCPFALRITAIRTQCRTFRTQGPGAQPSVKRARPSRAQLEKLGLKPQEPPTDHDLGGVDKARLEAIEWYERDRTGKEVLIDKVANKHDVKRIDDLEKMYEDSEEDPNYDTTELFKASIDSIASNPNFVDLRDELEAMKRLKEATRISEEKRKDIERDAAASVRLEIHENLQELIDNPDLAEMKEELMEVQRRLPEAEAALGNSPEWNALLERLEEKMENSEAYQRHVAAQEVGEESDATELPDRETPSDVDETQLEDAQDVDSLIQKMQGLLSDMGADPQLEKELEDLKNEDPLESSSENLSADEEHQAETYFESLSQDLSKLKGAPSPEELEDKNITPELQAQVDKILDDPNLMKKLAVIKDALDRAKNDITHMAQSAPDPLELDSSQTTTLASRLKIAENEPEHIIALRRLRINLLPPFNVAPALRSLNEALKLAYVGANDDVRRVLWRAYFKARTIPTLVQNIPDDAWDMLWYSQAVTWGSNENRQNHLRILLQDLKSVGRKGPPTHPKSLAEEEADLD